MFFEIIASQLDEASLVILLLPGCVSSVGNTGLQTSTLM